MNAECVLVASVGAVGAEVPGGTAGVAVADEAGVTWPALVAALHDK